LAFINLEHTDGVTQKIYLDGVLKNPSPLLGAMTYSSGGMIIGRTNSSGKFKLHLLGQLDDVRIYNYALSATQVQELYNNASAANFTPVNELRVMGYGLWVMGYGSAVMCHIESHRI